MSHEFPSFYYDQMGEEPITDDFIVPVGTELTEKLLQELIDEHKDSHLPRLEYLAAAYKTHYEIFGRDKKPDYKPDNRLAADMPTTSRRHSRATSSASQLTSRLTARVTMPRSPNT